MTRRAAVTEVCESHFKTDQAREVARAGASGTTDTGASSSSLTRLLKEKGDRRFGSRISLLERQPEQ
jgi:hypothetical protein